MSWKATVYVSELTVCPNGSNLTRDEKLVLFVLADHADRTTNEAFPSVSTLAKESLMSERHARDILRSVEHKGVIVSSSGGGRGNTSKYTFCELDKPGTACPLSGNNKPGIHRAPFIDKPGTNPAQTRHKGGTGECRNKEEPVTSNQGTENLSASQGESNPSPEGLTTATSTESEAATPTEKKSKAKSKSKPLAPIDERYTPFVEALSEYWKYKNPGVPMVFDQSEGKAVKEILAACPELDIETVKTCLRNRVKSQQVSHSQRPRIWIADILSYANGPLNRFKQPLEGDNGTRQTGGTRYIPPALQREAGNNLAVQIADEIARSQQGAEGPASDEPVGDDDQPGDLPGDPRGVW